MSPQALRISGCMCALAFLLHLGGCAAPTGPEVLTISANDYPQAFDAALEATRRLGMPAVFRDRRSGVIETDAEVAGSVIEPWRIDNASFSQALENTMAYQRRHARFEFSPAEMRSQAVPPDSDQPLRGPDVLGAQEEAIDLANERGELQLRVWVYVERANIPGFRRDTWSRRSDTITDLTVPEGEDGKAPSMSWTPIERDPAYERRLLAQVNEILAKQ